MTNTGTARLAVIDLETTGLDPDTGLILEVGVVVVDTTLREVAHCAVLLADPEAFAWAERTRQRSNNHAVLEVPERMHLDNGLVEDILAPGRFIDTQEEADVRAVCYRGAERAADTITAFLDEQGITEPVPMTGSSVRSLDGPFLQRHMPNLFCRFSHRTIDASALTEFAKFTDPDGHAAIMAEVPPAGHRTIEDCRRSLEILRRFALRYGVGAFSATGAA